MLASVPLAVFLLSTFVSASPTPQKRSAGLVPLARRSPHTDSAGTKLFDIEAARRERIRIRSKYRGEKKSALTPRVQRSIEKTEPFDIQTLRKRRTPRGTAYGSIPLTDDGPFDNRKSSRAEGDMLLIERSSILWADPM